MKCHQTHCLSEATHGHDGMAVACWAHSGLWSEVLPTTAAATPEPPPVPNDRPALWDLVMADMLARDAFGRAKYGTPLQPFNGRDALADAYQEALDLAVYLRQALFERDGR